MVDQYDVTDNLRHLELPPDIRDLVASIISGIMILAARAANSNSDSNSLGGILTHSAGKAQTMPEMKPRTKAPRDERLDAVCCAGPILATNNELAVNIQEKNIKDAIECGADALITSCPMCDIVLRQPTSQLGLPKIFITDLCRMALGEKPFP